MAAVMRVPPGRAGRLWLQRRLSSARQGADLLDHKLRALRTERQRLALQEDRTRTAWYEASRAADTWLLRGVLISGGQAVRPAGSRSFGQVEVVREHSMGLRYPTDATYSAPDPLEATAPVASAALVTARECCRKALEAAVEHAAAEAAVRIVEAEERATRRRLRAIEQRWIPRLEHALAELVLKLEEEEHAEGVRLRWAAGHWPSAGAGITGRGAR